MSAKAMAQLLKNDKVVTWFSKDGNVTIVRNDVILDFGGVVKGGGTNVVGLVVFSIAFGIVLNLIKENGKPLVSIFKSLCCATLKMVELIMW